MEHHERVVDVAGTGDACCCTWDGHGCDRGCMGGGGEDVCGGGSVDGGERRGRGGSDGGGVSILLWVESGRHKGGSETKGRGRGGGVQQA